MSLYLLTIGLFLIIVLHKNPEMTDPSKKKLHGLLLSSLYLSLPIFNRLSLSNNQWSLSLMLLSSEESENCVTLLSPWSPSKMMFSAFFFYFKTLANADPKTKTTRTSLKGRFIIGSVFDPQIRQLARSDTCRCF